ncbi:MAG: Ig domain-containing protein [Thermodesulfobacteriota bacterium]
MKNLLILTVNVVLFVVLACVTFGAEPELNRTLNQHFIIAQGENDYDLEEESEGSGTIIDLSENSPPRIRSMTVNLVSETNPRDGFRATVYAEDADGDEITILYQWSLNGDELIGEESDELDWREVFKKGDELTLQAIPTDGYNEGVWKAQGSIKIPNTPPRITSIPQGRMERGVFTYEVEAEDLDNDDIEFTLKNAPKGMSVEPATGKITWNFLENKATGTYKVTVAARDDDGGSATQELTLTIPGGEGEEEATEEFEEQEFGGVEEEEFEF